MDRCLEVNTSLALRYSSAHPAAGPLGDGWTIDGLSRIQRCGVPSNFRGVGPQDIQYDGDDLFCVDGEILIQQGATTYYDRTHYQAVGTEYRTNRDNLTLFRRVLENGLDGFEAHTPDGLVLKYGLGAYSRSGDPVEIWALNEIRDQLGNYTRIEWITASTSIGRVGLVPYIITYTYYDGIGVPKGAERRIQFVYEPMTGKVPRMYRRGRESRMDRRLVRIDTWARGERSLFYRFSGFPMTEAEECAGDPLGDAVCKPALHFEYQALDPVWTASGASRTWGPCNEHFYVVDANDDGRPDVLCDNRLWIQNSSGGYSNLQQLGAVADDILFAGMLHRGHNDPKQLYVILGRNSSWFWYRYTWNGSAMSLVGQGSLPYDIGGSSVPNHTPSLRASDLNNDGFTDLLFCGPVNSAQCRWYVSFGSINDFFSPYPVGDLQCTYDAEGTTTGCWDDAKILDVDGNGRLELLYGDSRVDFVNFSVEVAASNIGSAPLNGLLYDANGDALMDLWKDDIAYLNNGDGRFVTWNAAAISSPEGTRKRGVGPPTVLKTGDKSHRIQEERFATSSGEAEFLYVDLNGDSLTDRIHLGLVSDPISPASDRISIQEPNTGLLLQAWQWNANQPQVRFEYSKLENPVYDRTTCVDNSTSVCVDQLPNRYIVRNLWLDNGLAPGEGSALNRFAYVYRGARVDRDGMGFLGFAQVAVRDVTRQQSIIWSFDNSTFDINDPRLGPRRYPFLGLAKRIFVYSGPSIDQRTYERVTDRTYTRIRPSIHGVSSFTYRTLLDDETTVTREDFGEGLVETFRTRSEVLSRDDLGFTTWFRTVWGEESSPARSDFTTVRYNHDYEHWFLGRAASTTEQSFVPGSSMGRDTAYTYDPHGLLDEVIREPENISNPTAESGDPGANPPPSSGRAFPDPLRLYTTVLYNEYGQVKQLSQQDSRARLSHGGPIREPTVPDLEGDARIWTVDYDVLEGMLLERATDPRGEYSRYRQDPADGTTVVYEDPNGAFFVGQLDAFGRIVQGTAPGSSTVITVPGGAASLATSMDVLSRTLTTTQPRAVIHTGSHRVAGTFPSQITESGTTHLLDRLGRTVQSEWKNRSGSTVSQTTHYDTWGHVEWVSEPSFGSPVEEAERRVYDSRGRLQSVATERGTSVRTYTYPAPRRVCMTDARGHTTCRQWDAAGNLSEIIEPGGSKTTYAYGAFGILERMTDPMGNTIDLTSDVYGRTTSVRDANAGERRFYDSPYGDTLREDDLMGGIVDRYYDGLSRVVERQDHDGTASWIYDEGDGGIGNLSMAISPDGHSQEYGYDGWGRLVRRTDRFADLPSEAFGIGWTYDALGRLLTIKYPEVPHEAAPFRVLYSYGDNGAVRRISAGSDVLWEVLEDDAFGELKETRHGNDVHSNFDFDPESHRPALTTVWGTEGEPVYERSYVFDPVGNLTNRTDELRGISETYAYDALNRLSSMTPDSLHRPGRAWTYMPNGNIAASHLGILNYASPGPLTTNRPHAVSSITSGTQTLYTFAYSPRGNMTERRDLVRGTHFTMTWTAEDMLRSIDAPSLGRTAEFEYSADQVRVRKIADDHTVEYVSNLYERRTSNRRGKWQNDGFIFMPIIWALRR